MKNKLTIICLAAIIIVSSLSYMPVIFALPAIYNQLHVVILFAMVVLFLLANKYSDMLRNRYMNKILYPLLIFSMLIGLFSYWGWRVGTEDILQIGIVYVSLWIGYQMQLSDKTIITLLFLYSLIAMLLGYTSITTYLTSFSMDEDMYAITAKNQIGAIVALATFFMFYVAQCSTNKKVTILAYIFFAVLFVFLIYIRCRTALLAFLLTAFLIVYKLNSTKQLFAYLLCVIFLLALYSGQIFGVLEEAFIGDRTTANMDDLSSNRLERNEQALDYLSENLSMGEMWSHSGIEIIHNYVLNRMVRYGIWALALVYVYFVFVFKTIKQTLRFKKFTFYDIGYFAMCIPLICSLLEPDAPFGPGTVYSFTYMIFGLSLAKSFNK